MSCKMHPSYPTFLIVYFFATFSEGRLDSFSQQHRHLHHHMHHYHHTGLPPPYHQPHLQRSSFMLGEYVSNITFRSHQKVQLSGHMKNTASQIKSTTSQKQQELLYFLQLAFRSKNSKYLKVSKGKKYSVLWVVNLEMIIKPENNLHKVNK